MTEIFGYFLFQPSLEQKISSEAISSTLAQTVFKSDINGFKSHVLAIIF